MTDMTPLADADPFLADLIRKDVERQRRLKPTAKVKPRMPRKNSTTTTTERTVRMVLNVE